MTHWVLIGGLPQKLPPPAFWYSYPLSTPQHTLIHWQGKWPLPICSHKPNRSAVRPVPSRSTISRPQMVGLLLCCHEWKWTPWSSNSYSYSLYSGSFGVISKTWKEHLGPIFSVTSMVSCRLLRKSPLPPRLAKTVLWATRFQHGPGSVPGIGTDFTVISRGAAFNRFQGDHFCDMSSLNATRSFNKKVGSS